MLEKLIVHKLPDYDYIEIYPITDFNDGDPKTDEIMFKNFLKLHRRPMKGAILISMA